MQRKQSLAKVGEVALIERIRRKVYKGRDVVCGIGDDTAVLPFDRIHYMLWTTDMLIEDVHFTRRRATLAQIGRKAMMRNVSDIAAMGGIPCWALINMALPRTLSVRQVDQLVGGMLSAAKTFGIDIVGGDTASAKKIFLAVTLIGMVEKKNLALRCGAKPGDSIYVTGTLGGSILGKHLDFKPRLQEARFLVKNFPAHSLIDLSDGLMADLGHILRASRMGAQLHLERIPISQSARRLARRSGKPAILHALTDGEDYELLFTLPRREKKRLPVQWKKRFPLKLTRIGIITRRKGIQFIKNNQPLSFSVESPRGYEHFRP